MRIQKSTRQAAVISIASIILAGIVLLTLRRMYQVGQLGALELSVLLGVAAWLTLFVRRYGQGHIALGVYLLAIGGATIVLPRLLVLFVS